MPTLTESLHEQCRALITQRGMFTEDLLAALRLIAGRSDGMLSELMAGYGGLQYLLLNGLPFVGWDFSAGTFSTANMSFTRASDRLGTVEDFEGFLWPIKANEMRLQGLRRVENWVPNSNSPQNATVNTFSPAPSTNAVQAPDGTTTAWTILTGTTGFGQSNLTIPADRSAYVLSEYVKALAPGARVFLVANGINTVDTTAANTTSYYDFDTNSFGPGVGAASSEILDDGWVRISRKFQNNGVGTTFLVRTDAQPESAGKTAYWGFQLERVPTALSAASEYVSNGVLPTPFHGVFADGVKYFPTDRSGATIPSATRKGLLIEEASTNLCLRSSQFDDASWGKTNVTVTADSVLSPDGSISADTLTATAGSCNVAQVIPVLANTQYTWSFYARRGSLTQLTYSIWDETNGVNIVAPTSYYSQTNSSTWTRITLTFTTPGTCTSIRVYPLRDPGVTGDFYCWGAQLEQRAYSTSYIPTAGSTNLRSPDVGFVTPIPWFLNNQPGTLFAEGAILTAAGVVGLVAINDNSPNNRVDIRPNQGGSSYSFISLASVNVATLIQPGAVAAGVLSKYATAWAVNDFAFSRDGAAPVTDFTGGVPTGLTRMYLGLIDTGGVPLNGTLKSIRYYPSRLPDAQLQALTA